MLSVTAELEQRINDTEALRRQQLADTPPNTPHPTCPCGRSLNDHLESDILACDKLRQFLLGNYAPLAAGLAEFGRTQTVYVVYNIYRELPEPEGFMRMEETVRWMAERLMLNHEFLSLDGVLKIIWSILVETPNHHH